MIIKQTHNRSVNLRLHIKCRGAGGSDKAAAVCIKRHRVWIRAFDCVFQRNLRPIHSYGVFCYLTRRRSVRQQYLRIPTHAEAFLKIKQNRQRAPGCVFEILCIHIDFFNGVIYHPLKLQYAVVHAGRHRYRLRQLLDRTVWSGLLHPHKLKRIQICLFHSIGTQIFCFYIQITGIIVYVFIG